MRLSLAFSDAARYARLLSPAVGLALAATGIAGYVFWSIHAADIRTLLGRGDYERAYNKLLAAAEEGDQSSQNALGNLYYLGLGVEKDFRRALDWYLKAALFGNAPAQANMGHLYEQGLAVPEDIIRAYGWYSLALQRGYQNAAALLDNLTRVKGMQPNSIIKSKMLFSDLDKVRERILRNKRMIFKNIIFQKDGDLNE